MYNTDCDEGIYCEECDESYNDERYSLLAVGDCHERFVCPYGHVLPKAILSNYGFMFQQYLLQGSESETIWQYKD